MASIYRFTRTFCSGFRLISSFDGFFLLCLPLTIPFDKLFFLIREPDPEQSFPLFVAGQEMPTKLAAAKRPSVFSLFSSKKNAAEVTSAKARDELRKFCLPALIRIARHYARQPRTLIHFPHIVGRRVDDRETTAYSKRVTGAAGVNPEWSRLHEVCVTDNIQLFANITRRRCADPSFRYCRKWTSVRSVWRRQRRLRLVWPKMASSSGTQRQTSQTVSPSNK